MVHEDAIALGAELTVSQLREEETLARALERWRRSTPARRKPCVAVRRYHASMQSTTSAATPGEPLLIALVIDKSGSMEHLAEQTVAGFNEFLADQQAASPDALMSVTLFDQQRVFLHTASAIADIAPLTVTRYRGDGMGTTALNDAIGETVMAIDQSDARSGRKVLVVVITDGEENASTDFTTESIKTLVTMKERDGWKFVFFGANIDAFAEGGKRGVAPTRSKQYDATPDATRASFRKIAHAANAYRTSANDDALAAALDNDAPLSEPDPKPTVRPKKPTLGDAVARAVKKRNA